MVVNEGLLTPLLASQDIGHDFSNQLTLLLLLVSATALPEVTVSL